MSESLRAQAFPHAGDPDLAGFLPRAGALLADALLVAMLIQLAALALYPATGGRVQLKNSPFGATFCSPLATSGPPGGPELCRRAAFGRVFSSDLREGGWAKGRALPLVSAPVDAQGRLVPTVDLGWLFAPLLALWRIGFEASGGRSPGRIVSRTALVAAQGGRIGADRLTQRYTALVGPFLILSLIASAASLLGAASWAVASLASLSMVVIYGLFALDALRRRPPFHDRLARTRVVRRADDEA